MPLRLFSGSRVFCRQLGTHQKRLLARKQTLHGPQVHAFKALWARSVRFNAKGKEIHFIARVVA